MKLVSVSLRSIIHSYEVKILDSTIVILSFPSPYGVSFILILFDADNSALWEVKFPSPYGVSFILIQNRTNHHSKSLYVSVSLRSIIHSYFKHTYCYLYIFNKKVFPSPYGVSFILMEWYYMYQKLTMKVSVSLRSIIHSYSN